MATKIVFHRRPTRICKLTVNDNCWSYHFANYLGIQDIYNHTKFDCNNVIVTVSVFIHRRTKFTKFKINTYSNIFDMFYHCFPTVSLCMLLRKDEEI